VTSAQAGQQDKLVYLAPSGLQGGLEEVLVVLEGAHQPIPEGQLPATAFHLQAPPPGEAPAPAEPGASALSTDADRLRQHYQKIGEVGGHTYGQGLPGSKPPDFNIDPDAAARARPAASPAPTATPAPAGAPAQ
jgi:hypothetical protein